MSETINPKGYACPFCGGQLWIKRIITDEQLVLVNTSGKFDLADSVLGDDTEVKSVQLLCSDCDSEHPYLNYNDHDQTIGLKDEFKALVDACKEHLAGVSWQPNGKNLMVLFSIKANQAFFGMGLVRSVKQAWPDMLAELRRNYPVAAPAMPAPNRNGNWEIQIEVVPNE